MLLATKTCWRQNHPEIVINFDPGQVQESDARKFIAGLEKMVASGASFRPGHTFQYGWSMMQIAAAPDNYVTLHEFDLSVPPQLDASVTRTLMAARLQVKVLESFGLSKRAEPPSMWRKAIRCTAFLKSNGYALRRDASTGNDDSGWFFTCLDKDHDHNDVNNLEGGSLYEIACGRPEVIKYLAFPPGYMIVIESTGEAIAFDAEGNELEIQSGSYLDELRTNSANAT